VPARPVVLIVDDERPYVELLAELFSEHGYKVFTAISAGDAVQKATLLTPDVVLMDVMMPGLTGGEALRQLKADPRTRDIPVVMMTGHIIDHSRSKGPYAQAAALIMKPCTPAEMIETIDAVLRQGHSGT
jgi:CheY-like chemotaxis protein